MFYFSLDDALKLVINTPIHSSHRTRSRAADASVPRFAERVTFSLSSLMISRASSIALVVLASSSSPMLPSEVLTDRGRDNDPADRMITGAVRGIRRLNGTRRLGDGWSGDGMLFGCGLSDGMGCYVWLGTDLPTQFGNRSPYTNWGNRSPYTNWGHAHAGMMVQQQSS
jgi:hypothetical protein